jgi:hypothetical protein
VLFRSRYSPFGSLGEPESTWFWQLWLVNWSCWDLSGDFECQQECWSGRVEPAGGAWMMILDTTSRFPMLLDMLVHVALGIEFTWLEL